MSVAFTAVKRKPIAAKRSVALGYSRENMLWTQGHDGRSQIPLCSEHMLHSPLPRRREEQTSPATPALHCQPCCSFGRCLKSAAPSSAHTPGHNLAQHSSSPKPRSISIQQMALSKMPLSSRGQENGTKLTWKSPSYPGEEETISILAPQMLPSHVKDCTDTHRTRFLTGCKAQGKEFSLTFGVPTTKNWSTTWKMAKRPQQLSARIEVSTQLTAGCTPPHKLPELTSALQKEDQQAQCWLQGRMPPGPLLHFFVHGILLITDMAHSKTNTIIASRGDMQA